MKKSNKGWIILNGSGWNRHRTAEILNSMSGELPAIPLTYRVLVAPISDKPFGLRCALVKFFSHATSTKICDDDFDGEKDEWAFDKFGVEVERIYSCKTENPANDDSEYFFAKINEALKQL